MKKLIFVLIIIILFNWILTGQSEGKARIKGKVQDTKGEPISDVKVKLTHVVSKSSLTVKSDKKGEWKAIWIKYGNWRIEFLKDGYSPEKIYGEVSFKKKQLIVDTVTLKNVEGVIFEGSIKKDFAKGNKLFDKGKIDEALKVYMKIFTSHPKAVQILLNIGNCYFKKENYEKAIESYQGLLKQNPKHIKALLSTGNCYINLKQTEKALEYYKKIQISSIKDHIVLYNIGIVYFNAGKLNESLKFFKQSIEIKNDFPDSWYNLGLTYVSTGDFKQAAICFNSFLKLNKDPQKKTEVEEILKSIKQ